MAQIAGAAKNNALVDFPIEGLDISKYVYDKEGKSYVYDLYAISNHMGSLHGGHYTAYGKNALDG